MVRFTGLGFVAFGLSAWVALSATAQDQPHPRVEGPEVQPPRAQIDQLLELQKEIAAAMQARDPAKTQELVQKLQKAMMLDRNFAPLQFQIMPFPAGRDTPAPKSDLRLQYEKQLKEFAESIEKLKDDREARAAIEMARDEYKKAMEAELKKADDAQPLRPQPNFPNLPLPEFQRLEVPFPFADLDLGNARLNAAQPRLGVSLEKPSDVLAEQLDLKPEAGIVIVAVLRGTAAEKAGLKKNDILLQWAGKDLPADIGAFQAMIAAAKSSEKFDAVVLRKGKKEIVKGIELPESRRLQPNNLNRMQLQIEAFK